jgi:hypothetical protein
VALLDGNTVMTWTQTLDSAVPSDVTFAQSGMASISYYVGDDPVLPASGPVVYHSSSANLAPSIVTKSCSNIALGTDLKATWTILNGDTLSITVTLKQLKAWWVGHVHVALSAHVFDALSVAQGRVGLEPQVAHGHEGRGSCDWPL